MAEQENANPRFSFFPIILGMLEPNFDQESSERFVLLNPFTQSMVVLNGGAGILSAALGGATTESVTGRPPASKASIEALKIIKKEETENEAAEAEAEAECVVCLEKLFEKEKEEVVVKEMPCGHRYHGECIEKWLHMHGSCPMCRYNMPKEEGEGKKREEERGEGTGTGNGVWVRISFERRDEIAGDQRRSESD